MILERPELHEDKVRANVFARGQNEARLDDAVCCDLAQHADPPFAARQDGRVYLELASCGNVSGRCLLKGGDVCAVSELRLEISSENACIRQHEYRWLARVRGRAQKTFNNSRLTHGYLISL